MDRRMAAMVFTAAIASCGGEVARLPEVDVPAAELGAACLSGRYWPFGDRGNNHMHPGRDCVGCHARSGRGPVFAVAGTLYSAPHEVDECYGYDSDPAVPVSSIAVTPVRSPASTGSTEYSPIPLNTCTCRSISPGATINPSASTISSP